MSFIEDAGALVSLLVWLAFGAVAVFLVFVPFLDRKSGDGRESPLFTALAVAGVIYLVAFTILAQLAG